MTAGAKIISLEHERLRRRIRQELRELREAREEYENGPAAKENRRRLDEILPLIIEEVMGQPGALRRGAE